MPLEIIRNDITKVHADAIVNAANPSLLGGGGVDGAIHWAAGPELLEECRTLGGCKTGQAKVTKGYRLPAKYVIHTVGPVWQGGQHNEEKLLADCYRNCLTIAKDYNLESIAFPLISTGAYGYPKDKALATAISVIGDFLLHHDMMVYLVVYDKSSFVLSQKLFQSVKQYIDDQYVEQSPVRRMEVLENSYVSDESGYLHQSVTLDGINLEEILKEKDETFSQRLLRLIKEKDLKESDVYKKANMDRKLFSKIRNNPDYQPSKQTAIALAIALELNLDETKDLLLTAGYALSHSSKFDLIIEYFIKAGNYNIFEINEVLFAFDQKLLGV